MKSKDEMVIEKAAEELCNKDEYNAGVAGALNLDPVLLLNRKWGFHTGVAWRDKNPPPSVDADEAYRQFANSFTVREFGTLDREGILSFQDCFVAGFQAGQASERAKVQGLLKAAKGLRDGKDWLEFDDGCEQLASQFDQALAAFESEGK